MSVTPGYNDVVLILLSRCAGGEDVISYSRTGQMIEVVERCGRGVLISLPRSFVPKKIGHDHFPKK